MKIDKPREEILDSQQLKRDLELFIADSKVNQGAPCPNCETFVASECSPECARAPHALSSDPENHPLEEKVVPIAYELSSSGVFQTCWSCQGHLDQDGKLWKYPQVSFYVASPIYAQILLKYVNSLKSEGKLSYPWHVLVSDYGLQKGITYTLQPNLNLLTDIHLGKLQHDLITVSENMANNLKMIARQILAQL